MTELIVPAAAAGIGLWALYRRVDVFSAMADGAKSGLRVVFGIFPPLTALLAAVYMLRASGLAGMLAGALSPLLSLVGIPEETALIMLVRPFSGSGAIAAGAEIMAQSGPDSFIGRCAAVMLGSTETTFYVLAVYFGASGLKTPRRAVLAAVIADLTGFFASCVTVRLFFG